MKLIEEHASPLCISILCAAQNNLSHSPSDWVPSDPWLNPDPWFVRRAVTSGTVAPRLTFDI